MASVLEWLDRRVGLKCEFCGRRGGVRAYGFPEEPSVLAAHPECIAAPDGNHSHAEGIYADPYYAGE